MRVGLTGGVASGKSTVSALLAELGAVVIDADLLAREVVATGTEGLRRVVEEFGPEVLAETGQAGAFDAVLVVEVPVETQLARMVDLRGMSREDAEARVAAQATREQRLAVATDVIDNTGTREDLRERVAEVFKGLSARSGEDGR